MRSRTKQKGGVSTQTDFCKKRCVGSGVKEQRQLDAQQGPGRGQEKNKLDCAGGGGGGLGGEKNAVESAKKFGTYSIYETLVAGGRPGP